jgi:hypothetical protein
MYESVISNKHFHALLNCNDVLRYDLKDQQVTEETSKAYSSFMSYVYFFIRLMDSVIWDITRKEITYTWIT